MHDINLETTTKLLIDNERFGEGETGEYNSH